MINRSPFEELWMRVIQTLWLCGPLLVRDFALGISGLVAALIAFIAGCAFASTGNFAWFAYWGLLGTAGLCTSIPQVRGIAEMLRAADHADQSGSSLSMAAEQALQHQ